MCTVSFSPHGQFSVKNQLSEALLSLCTFFSPLYFPIKFFFPVSLHHLWWSDINTAVVRQPCDPPGQQREKADTDWLTEHTYRKRKREGFSPGMSNFVI